MLHRFTFTAFLALFQTTLWAQGTVVWSENFDGFSALPSGWSQQTGATDGGWKVATTLAHSSSNFAVPNRPGNVLATNDDRCNCNKSNEVVYLPPLDLRGYAKLSLLFDLYFLRRSFQGWRESLKLLASTDGGATWAELVEFDGRGEWRLVRVDISAYAGKANVRLAFRYDDAGDWLYGAALDNIRVVVPDNIVRARLASLGAGKYIPAVPTIISNYDKMLPHHQVALRGVVYNDGFPPITSCEVEVELTNGAKEVHRYEGLNIGIGSSHTFYIPYSVKLGTNNFSFKVRLLKVNGGQDNDPSDNNGTAYYSVVAVEPQPNRRVVIEEGTGTWCVWCPRGAVMMDYLAREYGKWAIPIAVHNGSSNPMRLAAYDEELSKLLGAYPMGLVEREKAIDPLQGNPNFEKSLIEHLTWPADVAISQVVEWNAATRRATVRSSARFLREMNGNYRLALVLTEDGIRGTGSGYNQANAYSGGARGPMGGYENLPHPVPAAQMVYNHVARALVGGFKGVPNSIPAKNPAGSVVSYEFSVDIPPSQNVKNMHAITLFIDQSTGRILNAESTPIPYFSSPVSELPAEPLHLSIAPNPVADEATITVQLDGVADVHLRVFNAMGVQVAERKYDNVSEHRFLPFRAGNLPNGMYTLVAVAKGQVVSTPFIVHR